MKKLIYSQEDVDLMISLEEQKYEEEIYDLRQEIEYLRSVGSLGILDRKCKELQKINNKQKEAIDKIRWELENNKYFLWENGQKIEMNLINKKIIKDILEEIE